MRKNVARGGKWAVRGKAEGTGTGVGGMNVYCRGRPLWVAVCPKSIYDPDG